MLKADQKEAQECEEKQMLELGAVTLSNRKLCKLPQAIQQLAIPATNCHTLNLSYNQLGDLPATFFGLFPHLVFLNVQFNRLSMIHCNIQLMARLQMLYLDHNALVCLPSSIGNLPYLQELVLSHNKISQLPSSLGRLEKSLLTLDVSENAIQTFPPEIGLLEKLKQLLLCHNHIVSLPTSLWQLKQLESFGCEWFRYLMPPLPPTLTGDCFFPLRQRFWGLCHELQIHGMLECAFTTFLHYFSEQPFTLSS